MYETQPPGLVIENYTYRQSLANRKNAYTRYSGSTFYKTALFKGVKNNHYALSNVAVGRDHELDRCCNILPFYLKDGDFMQLDSNEIRGNHYSIKVS